MRRFCIIFIFLLLGMSHILAQQNTHKELHFVYIAHDENTPVQTLVKRVKDTYQDALYYPDVRTVIFYFANEESPIVVKINTEDDNHADFPLIINEIQTKRSHNISPATDRKKIQEIFNDCDIIDEDGNKLYKTVRWTYYVNSTFWSLNCNESIIAALYFIMDMKTLSEDNYLRITILHGEEDPLPINKEYPFGYKNLCAGLNLLPMPY